MNALAILREQVHQTLTPAAARVAYSYLATDQFSLSDTWRSALLLTTDQHAGDIPRLQNNLEVVLKFGVPGAWTDAMLHDFSTFDLRTWLTCVRMLADLHEPRPPTTAR